MSDSLKATLGFIATGFLSIAIGFLLFSPDSPLFAQARPPIMAVPNSPSGCTNMTLPNGVVAFVYCVGTDGTGGFLIPPNCPNNLSVPSNAICGAAGGKGGVWRGSTTPYTVVP